MALQILPPDFQRSDTFDPTSQPVLPGIPLPVLPDECLQLAYIRDAFLRSVPWQVEPLFAESFVPAGPAYASARHAAVLMPLVQRTHGLNMLFTRRAAHLHDHAGQISFPGGCIEPGDIDAVDTAMRETHEEIGVGRQSVQIMGIQPSLLTTTGFLMAPVVGELLPGFSLVPDQSEVAEVFEVPLRVLMDPTQYRLHQLQTAWGHGRCYFSVRWQSYFIWGATAILLRNFYYFLAASAGLADHHPNR
ncbi:CoA pyrophosphatase [Castellaniella sp.]|uniref:CoA pyrophosphatase n=1 Tax=Castellaniella sp. TaxID=1955812 RepID=UPI002AFE7887|nr:CoA pyrophosphatase [Castellaniella sp.]